MTYQKILAALDGSSQGEAVFNQAIAIAKPYQAQLLFFHALIFDGRSMEAYSGIYGQNVMSLSSSLQEHIEAQTQEVETWLQNYSQRAQQEGLTVEYDWKIDDPSSWIRETAKSWDADLVILGRRGRRGLAEIFLGSVSNHVVHYAPCSVLVVQGKNVADSDASENG
ncbi:MAG: universal stress protein [Cyanobacteria bacterium SW_9_44_58]|nr:MAG: universal stress protein [Cyanobacteria bacterium SW_9_44_58]